MGWLLCRGERERKAAASLAETGWNGYYAGEREREKEREVESERHATARAAGVGKNKRL
jgi:hypothetical protein